MAGRHENKRRAPKGTRKPDPKKDRSAHKAARGMKIPSLRDLSNLIDVSEHTQDIIHELDHQTDRGVALIASALVELGLGRLMRCRMVHYEDCDEIIFAREGAPLGTFSARIKMARSMGVIGRLTEAHLDSIRLIRNQFAHSPLKIDFSHPAIAAEIDKLLTDAPDWRPGISPERRRYLGTAVALIQAFETREGERMEDKIPIWMN